MAMAQKIRVLLTMRSMTMKELAQKMGYSSGNLSNKLARDNFTERELTAIAEALDCAYEGIFTLRDTGKTV